MEEEKKESSRLGEIPDHIKDYIETRIAILKLTAAEKIGGAASSAALGGTLAFFGILFIVFASCGLALWLGECFNNLYQGFLAVGGIYLLLCVLIFFARKAMFINPITNSIIKKMTGNEDK